MSSRGKGWSLGIVLFCSACSLVQAPTRAPEIRLASLQPERLGVQRQVFLLRLVLDNPNDVELRVAAGRLRLDIEEIRIGAGELVDGFALPANAQGAATVRIQTDLLRQAPRLLSWLMTGDGTMNYRVTGYIDLVGLGLGRLPVDERGRLPLRPARDRSGSKAVAR